MKKFTSCILAVCMMCAIASAEAASTIDEYNRFILNGEPFFPLGLYVVHCPNGGYTAQLDEIANSPFDTVMNYAVNGCGGEATETQISQYLNALESRNLKLIFSVKDYFGPCTADNAGCANTRTREEVLNAVEAKVTAFRNHPAVVAWYMNDELCPACLEELQAGYQKIREVDTGNERVWSVHWNWQWLVQEKDATDIAGMDSYPIDHLPITAVSDVADKAGTTGKPVWIVPQIFNWQDYPWDFRAATGRPPTREEMRAMTYLAVNHGARGLIYYSYFNIRDDADYITRWAQIKEIGGEIAQLKHVFLSMDQANDTDVSCSNALIDSKVLRSGNTYYLFAVNTQESEVANISFQINLPEKPAVIETLFEGDRRLQASAGAFTDTFGIYEVHVYRWAQSGPFIDRVGPRLSLPGGIIRILGTGFGDGSGESAVHIGAIEYDISNPRIRLWTDTRIRVRIPFENKDCAWFNDGDGAYRTRKVWVTADGLDSNKKTLKVLRPAECP